MQEIESVRSHSPHACDGPIVFVANFESRIEGQHDPLNICRRLGVSSLPSAQEHVAGSCAWPLLVQAGEGSAANGDFDFFENVQRESSQPLDRFGG